MSVTEHGLTKPCELLCIWPWLNVAMWWLLCLHTIHYLVLMLSEWNRGPWSSFALQEHHAWTSKWKLNISNTDFQCSIALYFVCMSLKITPSHVWKMSVQNQVYHWELAVIVTNYRSYWSRYCKDSTAVVLYNCGFRNVVLQSSLFMVCLKILYCQIGWFVQNMEGSSYGLFEETE